MSDRKRILIVDDEDDLRSSLMDMLNAAGYEALEADSGNQGLHVAKHENPDLILLDINMPDLSGHKVWSLLKKDPQLQDIPILILSAKIQATDTYWGDKVLSQDYILKPFKKDALLRRIDQKIADYQAVQAG